MQVGAKFTVNMYNRSYSVEKGYVYVWHDGGYYERFSGSTVFSVDTQTYFDTPLKISVFANDTSSNKIRHVGNAVCHLADKTCGMLQLIFGTRVCGVITVKYHRIADHGVQMSKDLGIRVKINTFSFENVIGVIHYWGIFFADRFFNCTRSDVEQINGIQCRTTELCFQRVLEISRGKDPKYVPDSIFVDGGRRVEPSEDPCVLPIGACGDCEDSTRRFLVCITYFLTDRKMAHKYVPCAVFCMCSSNSAGGSGERHACGHACALVLKRDHYKALLKGAPVKKEHAVYLAEGTNNVWGGSCAPEHGTYPEEYIQRSASIIDTFYQKILFIVTGEGVRYLVQYTDPVDGKNDNAVSFNGFLHYGPADKRIKCTMVDSVDTVYSGSPSLPWPPSS
jgi:hypothetical protein